VTPRARTMTSEVDVEDITDQEEPV